MKTIRDVLRRNPKWAFSVFLNERGDLVVEMLAKVPAGVLSGKLVFSDETLGEFADPDGFVSYAILESERKMRLAIKGE